MGNGRKGVMALTIVCTRIAYMLRIPATGETHVICKGIELRGRSLKD